MAEARQVALEYVDEMNEETLLQGDKRRHCERGKRGEEKGMRLNQWQRKRRMASVEMDCEGHMWSFVKSCCFKGQ